LVAGQVVGKSCGSSPKPATVSSDLDLLKDIDAFPDPGEITHAVAFARVMFTVTAVDEAELYKLRGSITAHDPPAQD